MSKDDFEEKCRKICLVITDVDGVLTDGGMYYSENGDELKKFNVRDGVGVVLLQSAGLKVAAFTGEGTALIERRLKKIGVDFMFIGVKDKLACMNKFFAENNYSPEEVVYIGDEINDYCLLGNVGLFFTVSDANPEVKDKADLILETEGGDGALRELASILLNAQGKFEQALKLYMDKNTA